MTKYACRGCDSFDPDNHAWDCTRAMNIGVLVVWILFLTAVFA